MNDHVATEQDAFAAIVGFALFRADIQLAAPFKCIVQSGLDIIAEVRGRIMRDAFGEQLVARQTLFVKADEPDIVADEIRVSALHDFGGFVRTRDAFEPDGQAGKQRQCEDRENAFGTPPQECSHARYSANSPSNRPWAPRMKSHASRTAPRPPGRVDTQETCRRTKACPSAGAAENPQERRIGRSTTSSPI